MESWLRQCRKGFQGELNHKNSISNFPNMSYEVFLLLLILQPPNFLAIHLNHPTEKEITSLFYKILFLASKERLNNS